MDITKEMLQERILGLEQGLEQIAREFDGQLGALKEAKFWLAKLETKED